jgi:hypothetical protein
MDSVIAFLEKLVGFEVNPMILGGVAIVLELVLRLVKSPKPLGIIHSISGVLKKVSQLVGLVASSVAKVAELTDKVLPQVVAAPVIEEPKP